MRIDNVVFPPQKLPMKDKDAVWGKACIDAIIGRFGAGTYGGYTRKERMGISYGLYDSEFDKNDFKYITDPYSVGDVFPANMQNYNIIRPKIDLLMGEETKRPFSFRVLQTNEDAIGKAQEQKAKMLLQYMMSELRGENTQAQGQTPDYIQKYMRYTWKSVAEEVAENIIEYLKERLNLSEEFLKAFKDALVCGEEIYYTSIVNGEPFLERINPLECEFDRDTYTNFIDEKEWFRRTWYMTSTAIYNRFNDIMDEDDLDQMLAKFSSVSNKSQGPESPFQSIMYKENVTSRFVDNFRHDDRPYDSIEVNHCVWRSFKKVGFVSIEDELGIGEADGSQLPGSAKPPMDSSYNSKHLIDMVDESYKPAPGEKVEWDWITEIWEGYKLGEDLFLGIRPIPYQHMSLETLNDNRLPYTGLIYNHTNAYGKSLVEIMKPLQYMYMILWYRLELALARDKGKVITMDVTQIPKKYGFGIEKWMHYLTSLGVNFVNPYEEGWDTPGREGGKASGFNQFGAVDLGMGNVIAGYIQLMTKIEDMIGEISGVSRQREGAINNSELVGNVERAVTQSSHITEPIFWKHNQAKRRCFNLLLDVARYTYQESSKSKIQYIFSDGARNFLDVADDFLYSDFDIFISDSTKETQNLEAMKQLLQPAMQNGATLLDAAAILTADNMVLLKEKLKEIQDRHDQLVQQQQQQEMQMEQQKMQQEQQIAAETNKIREEDSIRKSDTLIQVALIQAGSQGTEDRQPELDSINDQYMEQQKIDIQKRKVDAEQQKTQTQSQLGMRAQAEAERKNRVAEDQKAQEIKLKQKTASQKPKTNKK
jgi:hypothetical protein